MHDFIEKVLVTHEEIVSRCKAMGKQITEEYQGKKPLFVGLLKGSIPFMAEIIKHIDTEMETEYLEASSYSGVSSTHSVVVTKDIKTPLLNRHVIIVEDIVDTGLTIREIINLFKDRGAASIEVCTLLNKEEGRTISGINPKYVGFEIENAFVVGFGLDYNQLYRNLDYVGILKRSVYEK